MCALERERDDEEMDAALFRLVERKSRADWKKLSSSSGSQLQAELGRVQARACGVMVRSVSSFRRVSLRRRSEREDGRTGGGLGWGGEVRTDMLRWVQRVEARVDIGEGLTVYTRMGSLPLLDM